MEPTVSKGALVIVKDLPGDATFSVSDIVAFQSPDEPDALLIKRVIAVGGQTVELRKGRLYLDGHAVTEAYLTTACDPDDDSHRSRFSSMPELHDFGPIALSDDELFLMGDNRDNSRDSRSWGAVKRSAVVGMISNVF